MLHCCICLFFAAYPAEQKNKNTRKIANKTKRNLKLCYENKNKTAEADLMCTAAKMKIHIKHSYWHNLQSTDTGPKIVGP